MAKDRARADRLAKQASNCQRQITHLESEMTKVQMMINDPNNADDNELQAQLDAMTASMADMTKKLVKVTKSTAPQLEVL